MKKGKIESIFGRKKVLLPVIHVESLRQVICNISTAISARADGVFLINHRIHNFTLGEIYKFVKNTYGDLWIGINFLDLYLEKAAEKAASLNADGFWTDNAGFYEDGVARVQASKKDLFDDEWEGLYFGGVAFKYQKEVSNFKRVTELADGKMDVITTSGEKTGSAPTISKIRDMSEAASVSSLGIASGITSENVRDFLPFCDCFLVSTGISLDYANLDLEKTKILSEVIHSWKE